MKTLLSILASLTFAAPLFAQTTTRVSLTSTGAELETPTYYPRLSGDGRYVVFSSASALLTPFGNGFSQIFVRDRDPDGNGILDEGNATTTLVSRNSAGVPGNGPSGQSTISEDGRWVAFATSATNFSGHAWIQGGGYVLDRDPDQDGIFDELGVVYHPVLGHNNVIPNTTTYEFDLSADGRYLAFTSLAVNLVPGDTNGQQDVFRWERATGQVVRCNVSNSGDQANMISRDCSISDDGRYVAFGSAATNLVPGTSSFGGDVFVRDLVAGTTTVVSVSSSGVVGNGISNGPFLSGNGQFVSFSTNARNFDPIDNDFHFDVYVRDLTNGVTELVSINSLGEKGNIGSGAAYLSSDASRVCFRSVATNLYWNDVAAWDVFVRDRVEGWTRQVSRASDGTHSNGQTAEFGGFHFSADGNTVAFTSEGTNLVAGDTNGQMDSFVHEICPSAGTELGGVLAGYMGRTPEAFACGDLATGSQAVVTLINGHPMRRGAFFVSTTQSSTPMHGGTLVPGQNASIFLFATDADGRAQVTIPGGGGPGTLYVQALIRDTQAPQSVSFSNALALPLLP